MATFKITCTAYGYTVVGKGTTSRLWNEVSREAEVYRILGEHRGLRYPSSSGRSTWPRSTSYMGPERFVTC
ncbi:hypothetical protein EYZ11_013331 [Aspergillus tanneri]|uniref:Uncharacterized protein n=1 Tax=Aspergillus tanneri TaxID=1220188 RepID=A0A4S3IY12_9EURO|nr:hypothetical protein EYZ11_013331 [Aspergillus tanneri]